MFFRKVLVRVTHRFIRSWLRFSRRWPGFFLLFVLPAGWSPGTPVNSLPTSEGAPLAAGAVVHESALADVTVFDRIGAAGPVVCVVLLFLVFMSVLTWAVFAARWLYLVQMDKNCEQFIKSFWDSRSLNDLNGRLQNYPGSPVKELFKNGYAELVRGSQMKDAAPQAYSELAISVAMDNLTRTLHKSRQQEKKRLERYLSVLAISASACPFVGLFGTVWGIMSSFEGIARTGSSSLAAVAPGISEALVATAFGLAAAIPAVVGYNIAVYRIRAMMTSLDGFGNDFLNIVERYLFSDKSSRDNIRQNSRESVPDPQAPGI